MAWREYVYIKITDRIAALQTGYEVSHGYLGFSVAQNIAKIVKYS